MKHLVPSGSGGASYGMQSVLTASWVAERSSSSSLKRAKKGENGRVVRVVSQARNDSQAMVLFVARRLLGGLLARGLDFPLTLPAPQSPLPSTLS